MRALFAARTIGLGRSVLLPGSLFLVRRLPLEGPAFGQRLRFFALPPTL